METRDVNYYMSQPYHIEIIKDNNPEDPGWVASVIELPGCMTQADTFKELGEMIEDAMRAWIETALEENIPIPEPRIEEEYSGKFVVRVPKSLHRELVELAKRESVSLNAYVSAAVGKAVGQSGTDLKPTASDLEPTPVVNWPRLSDQARRIMVANGLSQEIQEVDEKMFSGWIEEHLYQIRAAIEQGYYRDALQYIQRIRQSLETLCGQSPLVTTYCQVVSLLEEQIDLNTRLREGLIEQSYLKSRITTQTRMTSQSTVSSLRRAESDRDIRERAEDLTEEDKKALRWASRTMEIE